MNKETEQTSSQGDTMTEIDLTANESDQPVEKNPSLLAKLLPILCLLGLIILAGVMYYVVEQGKQQLSAIKSEVQTKLDQGLADLSSQQQQIEQQTQSEQQALSEQQQLLDELKASQTNIEQTMTALSAEQPDSNLDWSLAEVEHLMVIAIQQVQLSENPQSAIAALESADQRLRDMADPSLLSIRQQLTKDINSLKAVNQVDIAGMSLYLSDLIAKVNSLPLNDINPNVQSAEPAQDITESAEANDWQGQLHKLTSMIWQELKTMVVVKRKDDAGNSAFILPEQQYYLYENLRLELTNAKLAVLSRDTANLQNSIDTITAWLQQHFKTSDSAIVNIQEALDKMKTVQLQPDLPDISSSLETLRATLRESQMEQN